MLKQFTRAMLYIALSIAVLLVLVAGALRFANAFAGVPLPSLTMATPTAATSVPAITIHNAGPGSSVGAIPAYTLGIWPGNDTPAAGSQFTIFARISHQTQPVAGLQISIYAAGQSYGATTNSDGIAIFAVKAANTGPVSVTGSVTINGQTITATTSYNPV